jgi:hypothetical protein
MSLILRSISSFRSPIFRRFAPVLRVGGGLAVLPRASALAAGGLTALAFFAAAAVVHAPAAAASHTQTVFFEAPKDLLTGATRASSFARLQQLGVSALRVELHWRDVAPGGASARRPAFDATDPRSYNWGDYDAVIAEAARLKWQVLLTVTAPVPKWATAGHRDYVTRPDDLQFEQFMTAVGRHYAPFVSLYAIWNEPNIPGWLRPQFNTNGTPASPRIYRGLWQSGYAGLKAAGLASPKVLFGETAPFGVTHARHRSEINKLELAPLVFMREALCLSRSYRKSSTCEALPIAGYAHHPYTYPAVQGPYYRPPERDEVTLGSLSRLSSALDKAANAHAIPAHVPMYLTEYGVQSKPNSLGVPLQAQAEYDAISEKIAWGNSRVVAFSQYLLTDEHPHGAFNGYRTGLLTTGGSRKPLFFAWPLPLVVSRTHSGDSLWGLVRPAGGVTKVRIKVEPRGSHRWRTLAVVTTDAHGYWRLRSSVRGSYWRVSWRSPAGVAYNGPAIRSS